MRKLTIINQQYTPETASTGQIFATIAEYMQENGFSVKVVTGKPYYQKSDQKCPGREIINGVMVRRLPGTTFSKKSFFGKLLNLLTFEISLFFYCIFRISRQETVLVATAPPMAVVAAAFGKFFRRYRIVMTVQDLYPDVLAASGMSSARRPTYKVLALLMKRSMKACVRVVAISTDMQRHLMEAYGLNDVQLIPNLFPEKIEAISSDEPKALRGWQDKTVVQYSGNFGVAHEYETLLGAVRILQGEPDILFQIAGAGRNFDKLQQICQQEQLKNIVFEGYAPLDKLERHLATADVSIVVLSEAFQNVLLPSKYYGILASGRGVLLISGCDSDIKRDIQAMDIGMVIQHGESEKLAATLVALRKLPKIVKEMNTRARALYDQTYSQRMILEAYRKLLEDVR